MSFFIPSRSSSSSETGPRCLRALLIATFLGLLELIRLREVVAAQVDRFGEIWIRAKKEDVVAP